MAVHTSQSQIVAEILGLPIEKIKPVWGDSWVVPQTMQAVSSRMAMAMGTASRRAAESILQQLFEIAAPQLGVSPDGMEAEDGNIQVKGAPETAIPFGTLVGSGGCITGVGDHPGASEFRSNFAMVIQAGSAYEVEVDMDSGAVNFLQAINGIDCGRALNPDIIEGQVLGAGVSQMGAAMMHEVIYDPATGVVLNTSHSDYLYPTAADIPPTETVLVESIDPWTAFGQKGVAEMGLCSPAQGIINTIANATGVWVRQIPITPDVLLKALGKI